MNSDFSTDPKGHERLSWILVEGLEFHDGCSRKCIPAEHEAARAKYADLEAWNPEVKEHVEQMDRYAAARG